MTLPPGDWDVKEEKRIIVEPHVDEPESHPWLTCATVCFIVGVLLFLMMQAGM